LNDAFDQEWLADELGRRLAGRQMSIASVKEFVLVETPCYLFKSALGTLEGRKVGALTVVSAPAGRKPKTFPSDAIVVRFSTTVPDTQRLLI
jgi:hypothetical protein